MTAPEQPTTPDRYPFGLPIQTRWADCDAYGHVNNAVAYSYFDTAVTAYLVAQGGMDTTTSQAIGYVVESGCRYLRPMAFPAVVDARVRVAKLGRSSVRYEIGLFTPDTGTAAAEGFFVHVFVDRETERPTPIPDALRTALERLAG